MDNQIPHLRDLFSKYASGTASRAEVEELLAMLALGKYDQEMLSDMQARMEEDVVPAELNLERWNGVLAGIQERIAVEPAQKTRRLWPRVGIAAAVATVILSAGIWFYAANHNDSAPQVAALTNDVAPGKQSATLTLASGKKIRLADAVNGKLANEAGVSITKTAEGELVYQVENTSNENKINTIATANGETYQVRLPDGSAVWLNAGSSLTYSASLLQNGKRNVRLSGEGYFEVAKDKAHPFVVSTDREEVEVLGTHFNVSSYSDDPFSRTTLQEGSIRMNGKTVLKPGEQAIVGAADALRVEEVDVDEALAWKNGKFVFADEDIESIMRKLARWYDVEVVYKGEKPDAIFTASISRADNIGKILSKLSFARKVKFKVEGRRVTVMK